MELNKNHHSFNPRLAQNLPHLCRFFHLLPCIFLLISCQNIAETSSTQRYLGEFSSDTLNLTLSVTPGLIEDADEESKIIQARSSSGISQVSMRTGPNVSETLTLTLSNIHPSVELRPRVIRRLSSLDTLGATCSESLEDVDINCDDDPDNTLCSPVTQRAMTTTTASFVLSPQPCLETVYRLELQDALQDEPLSFVVIGSLTDPNDINKIHNHELALGHTHDFYVILGDALQNKSETDVVALKRITSALNTVSVVLPGEEEILDDQGQLFESLFGSFDFRWTIKNTQFLSYYSATQNISTYGLSSIQGSLRAMQSEDQQWRVNNEITLEEGQARALPAFAFTHTPLSDPDGLREMGLQSRLQASRVASLFSAAGLHAVFSGHILDNQHVTSSTPNAIITSSQNTRLESSLASYRRVTINSSQTTESVPVGNFFMTMSTLSVPD